jgi:nucleoside phosphorylase
MEVRILLVDDEFEKARLISDALTACTHAKISLKHESTAAGARQSMRDQYFDLLIVDVNLPDNISTPANPRAGFELLEMMRLDSQVNLPGDVIFVTAKEDLLAEAIASAAKRGAGVCSFRNDEELWKTILIGKVDYISLCLQRNHRPKVDIAIITALGTPELDAVLALPYSWTSRRFPGDPTSYHFGSLEVGSTTLTMVAANAARKGMPSSASLASKLALSFKPKLLVMLGICGGIAGKVNLGDVVVADPTWDWGSGKHAQGDEGSRAFRASPYQSALKPTLAGLIADAIRDPAVISNVRAGWLGETPQGRLNVHLGPMASGAAVLAQDGAVDVITDGNREVLAVEMEAYAVMAAAETCSITALVMKSVCDYADPSKNDDWQAYASYTSAAFFDQLIRRSARELFD